MAHAALLLSRPKYADESRLTSEIGCCDALLEHLTLCTLTYPHQAETILVSTRMVLSPPLVVTVSITSGRVQALENYLTKNEQPAAMEDRCLVQCVIAVGSRPISPPKCIFGVTGFKPALGLPKVPSLAVPVPQIMWGCQLRRSIRSLTGQILDLHQDAISGESPTNKIYWAQWDTLWSVAVMLDLS
ncbi:hypothetical protein E2C01_041618 [Portunus trituberculatus]|uniref:Uncharacterized protein n=1 Tax=Portunus trituberculatus TaxID=210409 RepID=A0A5B7FRE5_PORTR|nr:hypothetical protein [Portunus trituberculatus]